MIVLMRKILRSALIAAGLFFVFLNRDNVWALFSSNLFVRMDRGADSTSRARMLDYVVRRFPVGGDLNAPIEFLKGAGARCYHTDRNKDKWFCYAEGNSSLIPPVNREWVIAINFDEKEKIIAGYEVYLHSTGL